MKQFNNRYWELNLDIGVTCDLGGAGVVDVEGAVTGSSQGHSVTCVRRSRCGTDFIIRNGDLRRERETGRSIGL
jgi:hypothetical protein